jgi:transposase
MEYEKYVSADVHSATTTFCVLDKNGRVTMEATVETTERALLSFVKGLGGRVYLTFEEGTQAAWMYDMLNPHVAKLTVCDPRQNKLITGGDKGDRVDAEELAQLLRGGYLKPVYHGEHGTGRLKELVRAQQNLVQDSVRIQNRIHAVFRSQGVGVGRKAVRAPSHREEWLGHLERKGVIERVEWLYEELDAVEALRTKAERSLEGESRRHRACELLQGLPGIGTIRSAQIVAIVATPFRFRTKRQFWAYCGLAVVSRSSADFEVTAKGIRKKKRPARTRGLNNDYNRVLKAVFKGAAIDATTRGDLKEDFQRRVSLGMRPEMALLTAARKISAMSLAVWKKGEAYDRNKALMRKP